MASHRPVSKNSVASWRTWTFWRNLALYFLIFSYIGHFIEIGWTWVRHLIFGDPLLDAVLVNPLEPYTIYGAGAVLCILVVLPIARKFGGKLLATFLVGAVVCAALEYISSVILVWRYGRNPYWWYADRPFNLGGHICLENSLLFGVLAVLFLRFLYPLTEKLLRHSNQIAVNVLLFALAIMCACYYLAPLFG